MMITLAPNTATDDKGFGLGVCPSGSAEGIEWREPANFELLYRTHSRRVYSLCKRMTGDIAEAEDLTQEAFVHLYRKLDTFRGESTFYTWFHRLAVNVVLMRLRKRKKSRETLLEDTDCPDPSDARPYPAANRSTESPLSARLDHVDLQRAIDALPAGFKTVFVLHDIEGYEHHEIAEMTGLSIGTSKSQLHKARVRVRKLLREGLRAKTQPRRARLRPSVPLPGAFQAYPLSAT